MDSGFLADLPGRSSETGDASPAAVSNSPSRRAQGRDSGKVRDLTGKLAEKGLLGAATFSMCGDEDEAKCASVKQMRAVWKALKRGVKARRKAGTADAAAVRTKCLGVCRQGPLVSVEPAGCWYAECSAEDVEAILSHHLEQGPMPAAIRVDRVPVTDQCGSIRDSR